MKFKVGDIVHNAKTGIPERPTKYMVCVCPAQRLYFFINTEDRAIYDCIPLYKKGTRSFPIHDSFIACDATFDYPDFHLSYVAQLDSQELRGLVEKVESSRFLPKGQIKVITEALRGHRR